MNESTAFYRVWGRVYRPEHGCWEFRKGEARGVKGGYVQVPTGYTDTGGPIVKLAHRLVFEMVNGPIPAGLVVRHLCNNPRCIRIEHLAVGTTS